MSGIVYGLIAQRDFQGKTYDNYDYVTRQLESFTDMTKLISGGGKGVEYLAEKWATQSNLPFKRIPPDIEENGQNAAFVIRNNAIINECEVLIVFWDGNNTKVIETLSTAMLCKREVILLPLQ